MVLDWPLAPCNSATVSSSLVMAIHSGRAPMT